MKYTFKVLLNTYETNSNVTHTTYVSSGVRANWQWFFNNISLKDIVPVEHLDKRYKVYAKLLSNRNLFDSAGYYPNEYYLSVTPSFSGQKCVSYAKEFTNVDQIITHSALIQDNSTAGTLISSQFTSPYENEVSFEVETLLYLDQFKVEFWKRTNATISLKGNSLDSNIIKMCVLLTFVEI